MFAVFYRHFSDVWGCSLRGSPAITLGSIFRYEGQQFKKTALPAPRLEGLSRPTEWRKGWRKSTRQPPPRQCQKMGHVCGQVWKRSSQHSAKLRNPTRSQFSKYCDSKPLTWIPSTARIALNLSSRALLFPCVKLSRAPRISLGPLLPRSAQPKHPEDWSPAMPQQGILCYALSLSSVVLGSHGEERFGPPAQGDGGRIPQENSL